jgi:hypothetical protein
MIDSLFLSERADKEDDEDEDVEVLGETSDLISLCSSMSIETGFISTEGGRFVFDWLESVSIDVIAS